MLLTLLTLQPFRTQCRENYWLYNISKVNVLKTNGCSNIIFVTVSKTYGVSNIIVGIVLKQFHQHCFGKCCKTNGFSSFPAAP